MSDGANGSWPASRRRRSAVTPRSSSAACSRARHGALAVACGRRRPHQRQKSAGRRASASRGWCWWAGILLVVGAVVVRRRRAARTLTRPGSAPAWRSCSRDRCAGALAGTSFPATPRPGPGLPPTPFGSRGPDPRSASSGSCSGRWTLAAATRSGCRPRRHPSDAPGGPRAIPARLGWVAPGSAAIGVPGDQELLTSWHTAVGRRSGHSTPPSDRLSARRLLITSEPAAHLPSSPPPIRRADPADAPIGACTLTSSSPDPGLVAALSPPPRRPVGRRPRGRAVRRRAACRSPSWTRSTGCP